MHKMISGYILIIGILVGSFLVGLGINISDSIMYLPIIIVSMIFLLLAAVNDYDSKISWVVITALVLRFCVMLWNVYGREIYCLPGVGTDTEGFYESAVTISSDLSYLKSNLYGTYYSKYLGVLFYFTGPSYLLGSYLNFYFSAMSISLLYRTLCKINSIDIKALRFSMVIFALEPNGMIIGSSLRRESLMILFVIASIYYIIKWTTSNITLQGVLALICVLAASILHAGVAGITVGYIMLLLFYNPLSARWRIRRKSIAMMIVIVLGASIVLSQYRATFFSKILIEDTTILFRRANRAPGEAAYLANITINSFGSLVVYLPLKMLYFIASPVPWNWRGIFDAIAFLLDAVIYIYLVKNCASSLIKPRKEPVAFALGISFLASFVIYAIGCANSANAMRHRLKLLGLMIVIAYIVRAYRNRYRGSIL